MSRVGVAATVRVEVHVGCLSHLAMRAATQTGQWAIPFIIWQKPVPRLTAAKGLKQLQRVEDGAMLAPITEESTLPH